MCAFMEQFILSEIHLLASSKVLCLLRVDSGAVVHCLSISEQMKCEIVMVSGDGRFTLISEIFGAQYFRYEGKRPG